MGTRIELCGQLAVEIEGTRIEGSLRGRQGRLLLAYLVLNRHRPIRQRLAKLRYGSVDLWGNAEAARRVPGRGR